METVVLVMMILVCFNYILKQTYRKPYAVVFSAAVCALFTGSMWRYAVEQSKSQISIWLSDSALMLDVAVVLTLEVAIQMAFCILSAYMQTSGKVKPRTIWAYRILRWFPGVLIFPVLFSLLVSVIFVLPGMSFPTVAWSLAGTVFVVLTGGTYGMKRLLPEKEIRLELALPLERPDCRSGSHRHGKRPDGRCRHQRSELDGTCGSSLVCCRRTYLRDAFVQNQIEKNN